MLFLLPLLVPPMIASAEGINLSWDDCGASGVSFKTFACDDNDGPADVMVASFSPPEGIDEFNGAVATIDIRVSSTQLPDWWEHFGTFPEGTACRDSSGLSVDTNFGDTCANPYSVRPPDGANYSYRLMFQGIDRARLVVAVGYLKPTGPQPVPPGPEYYACRILIKHYRSYGDESCQGCSIPACIVLNTIQLFDNADIIDPTIYFPLDRNYVTWQADVPDCPLSTPARRATWGQVKSLYR